MINEKVAVPVVKTKISTIHIPAILIPIEITIPVVLADEISHTIHSLCVFIAGNKVCLRLNKNPYWLCRLLLE